MRVALFFDGKNFYSGLKDRAPDNIIDFTKMSRWLVKQVGGSHLWGAYYYTGVEIGPGSRSEGQSKLSGFLDMLELQPGFFVKRFPRKVHSFNCVSCGAINRFTLEKEIDTTMAADMLQLAAVGAFDIMVLLSGDADHTPAVEAVRTLGKQVYVATWGRTGLSTRIRKSVFDHIDLLDGLPNFATRADEYREQQAQRYSDDEMEDLIIDQAMLDIFMDELHKAEMTFSTGYVGMNYFLKRWQSDRMLPNAEDRRHIMDVLIDEERVEVYEAPDGNKALRIIDPDYRPDEREDERLSQIVDVDIVVQQNDDDFDDDEQ
jgi:uncharacterized LabA/DUF88 family protein